MISLNGTTSSSNITFSGEMNERIRLSFKSNIEAGELDIILYDSSGNMVYELDKAIEVTHWPDEIPTELVNMF